MSKEIDTQQILLQEDSHANPSALQEREKEHQMTATSGMKLLESSESVNLDGSLGKMLKALLTSKTAWSSDRCVMTWKKKVSKSNVLLFQLQASVRGIKGKESGFLPTPNTMDHIDRKGMRPSRAATNRKSGYLSEMIKMYPTPTQDSASERTKKYKQGGTPLPLAVKMYPTPTVGCEEGGEQSNRVEQTKSGGFVLRKKNKPEMTFGAKLSDAMLYLEKKMYPTPTSQDHSRNTVPPSIGKTRGMDLSMRVVADEIEKQKKMYPTPRASAAMNENLETVKKRVERRGKLGAKLEETIATMMPTPTARDHKDMGYQPTWKPSRDKSVPRTVLKNNKPGGKLNPHFVEMLMAYPMNWTKIEPTESKVSETQSFPSSQENLDSPSSKQKRMYRTPTAMDIAEDSFIFAAKLLKGKINRSFNSRVQITLSTDVAMEYLKSNPHLIDEYDKPFKIRPNLPNKFEFISYLKSNSTIKDLANKTDLPKTKIEHWFRKDKCFSYPSIEDWNKIKPYLKTIQFDDELTYEIDEDWKS